MGTQDDTTKIIRNYQRRLQKLKEQQALEGRSADPKILIEIEDIEQIIARIEAEGGELRGTSPLEATDSAGNLGNIQSPLVAPVSGTITVYVRNEDLGIQRSLQVLPHLTGWRIMAQVCTALDLKDSVSAAGGLILLRFSYRLLYNNQILSDQLPLAQLGVTDGSILDLLVTVEQSTSTRRLIAVDYRPEKEVDTLTPEMKRRLILKAFKHLL